MQCVLRSTPIKKERGKNIHGYTDDFDLPRQVLFNDVESCVVTIVMTVMMVVFMIMTDNIDHP